jgi:hypothetical protein
MADAVFSRFEIEFDHVKPIAPLVFNGGELLTGHLRIQLKQPLTIHAIKLQFKGRACWLNETSKSGEVEKVYFDRDLVLLERPPGRQPGDFPWLADHLYSLPFECPLPKGCPTSYEGPHAFIRYFARATVEEGDGKSKSKAAYVVKKPFTIVALVETPVNPEALRPIAASEATTFGGCCCRGKLTAEIGLPKSLYYPGETVHGTLKIDNRHPRHVIDQIEVRLIDQVQSIKSANILLISLTSLKIRYFWAKI